MKRIALVLLILSLPQMAEGQAATSASKLTWDQDAVSASEAQSFTYKYFPDNSTVGINLTGVVCTGTTSPFVCTVSFPAFTPGNHNLVMSAANTAGESLKSSPFVFAFVVIPNPPRNIRIGSGNVLGPE